MCIRDSLYMIALELGRIKGTLPKEQYSKLLEELKRLPALAEKILEDKQAVQHLASQRYMDEHEFFIGRGMDYALMLEGSLKLKELSYIHSEAYPSGELKHGPIALIEKGTLVMALATQEALMEKSLSNFKEVKARGAYVVAVVQEHHKHLLEKDVDLVLTIPDAGDMFAPLLAVLFYQLYGYYTAVLKGCDVDKPRNLAKSVTVE